MLYVIIINNTCTHYSVVNMGTLGEGQGYSVIVDPSRVFVNLPCMYLSSIDKNKSYNT